MQINFYMDEEDRHRFHEFIFERDGYLTPEVWPRREAPCYERHADGYRKLESFYNACCRYIRKNFRKEVAGFYHGAGSDHAVMNGAVKLQI